LWLPPHYTNWHSHRHQAIHDSVPDPLSPPHGTSPVRLLSPPLYLLCMLRPTRDVCLSACIVTIPPTLQRFLRNFEITGPPGEKFPHWAPIYTARALW